MVITSWTFPLVNVKPCFNIIPTCSLGHVLSSVHWKSKTAMVVSLSLNTVKGVNHKLLDDLREHVQIAFPSLSHASSLVSAWYGAAFNLFKSFCFCVVHLFSRYVPDSTYFFLYRTFGHHSFASEWWKNRCQWGCWALWIVVRSPWSNALVAMLHSYIDQSPPCAMVMSLP